MGDIDVRDNLRIYADSALKKSAGGYVCPVCGSGTGEHKTGALYLYNDGRKWKCHKCGAGGDIYDLIGAVEHIGGFKERKKRALELAGASLDEANQGKAAAGRQAIADAEHEGGAESGTNFMPFFLEAQTHLEEPPCSAYLSKRGLSIETAKIYGLGYCADWRHPKAPNSPASPRLIIPTSPYSYLARDIRDDLTEAQARYAKSKAGKQAILGLDGALFFATKPIFIVEGEIDAMSVAEAGGEAIALGSASNVNRFFTELAARRFFYPLILSLDDDEAGRQAETELAAGLEARSLPFIRFSVSAGLKDANEALQKDRAGFFALVREGERLASEMMIGRNDEGGATNTKKGDDDMKDSAIAIKTRSDEAKSETEAKKKAFLAMSVAERARGFSARTRGLKDERGLSTGLKSLDEALGGGLFPGLFILGGGTSIGKTAFMLQIADAIARAECEAAQELDAQGGARRGVLYFSLETGADELLARSVSRLSRTRYKERAIRYADILDGFRRARDYEGGMSIFQDCLIEHEGYGAFEFIHESVAGISIDGIIEGIAAFEGYTGLKPVVFVDYLQIIPHNDIVSDKRAVDASVLALKRAARDFNVPIIAASSVNRANYGEDVGLASYKESGGIEYGADVLLGLQWKDGADTSECKGKQDVERAQAKADAANRQKEAAGVVAKVLKNRRGGAGRQAELYFDKPFALFTEGGGASDKPRMEIRERGQWR